MAKFTGLRAAGSAASGVGSSAGGFASAARTRVAGAQSLASGIAAGLTGLGNAIGGKKVRDETNARRDKERAEDLAYRDGRAASSDTQRQVMAMRNLYDDEVNVGERHRQQIEMLQARGESLEPDDPSRAMIQKTLENANKQLAESQARQQNLRLGIMQRVTAWGRGQGVPDT